MGLWETAKNDIANITTNTDEWGKSATFTAPDSTTATVNVLPTKHWTGWSEDGARVSSKYGSIAVSESILEAAGYPVRIDDEVNLENHRVSVEDSTDTVKNYTILEWYPDEAVGLIVCILGDFENA